MEIKDQASLKLFKEKHWCDVLSERQRQDAKWGEQNHDNMVWTAILTEEVGEFAQAALQVRFGGSKGMGLRDEAVQVAAVAIAIIECIDRNEKNKKK